MKTSSLASYPHLRTRQDLANACKGAKTIFLCGQASDSAKLTVARALAQEIPGQKLLYISCEDFKKTSQHSATDTVSSEAIPSQVGNLQNLSAVFLHGSCAETLRKMLQASSSIYTHFIVAVSGSKPEAIFPTWADTLLLFPGKLGNHRLYTLMGQIYDHDYTIAGVVEEEAIPTLHTDEMSSESFMLCKAEGK